MADNSYIQQLLGIAKEQKNFADRLRDEREAYKKQVGQFASQVTPQDQYTSNGVPLQPSKVSAGRQSFLGAVEQAASPFSPELEMTARDKEANILAELVNLSEKQKSSQPTIDPETGLPDYSNVDEDTALAIVNKDGRRLLSGGLNEKKAQAQAILSYGSVDNYLQKAPLSDIYSLKTFENEAKADEAGFDLLRRVNAAQAYFQPGASDDFFGTGNLTGFLAGRKGFLRGGKQREAQAVLGELSAEKINELSGAAVSDQEFQRLKAFIPTATMQEGEVASQLDKMAKAVEMNLQAREDAVRSGMTVSEYWKKNKDQYLSKYGFSNEENKSSQIDISSEVNKYW